MEHFTEVDFGELDFSLIRSMSFEPNGNFRIVYKDGNEGYYSFD